MCNLYRQDVSQSRISSFLEPSGLKLSGQARGRNVEPGYVGADADGPVLVHVGATASSAWENKASGALDLLSLRWGFPPVMKGKRPITNIRNLQSSWWTGVNGEFVTDARYRCLVPFAAFAEWNREKERNSWFEIGCEAPMFAGVWRPWTGERLKDVGKARRQRREDDWKLYAFLTTEPNSVVAPVHPRAMPVILTEPEECEHWMAGGAESLELQRPLPDGLTTLS